VCILRTTHWLSILCFIGFGLVVGQAHAEKAYSLIKISDGDTVTLRDLSGKFRLRLTGIDAPERNQAYGKKSRRALIKLCQQPNVVITAHITGTDRYQRKLGRLYCNEVDASLHLTKLGLAWHNYKYSNDMAIFIAHIQARYNNIGLWAEKNPMAPWDWRRQHQRKYKPKSVKH
jgi:micrococcal nuclease